MNLLPREVAEERMLARVRRGMWVGIGSAAALIAMYAGSAALTLRSESQRAQGLPVRLLAEPDGAFYALLQLDRGAAGSLSGDTLMRRLVREHRVATLSGGSFGLDSSDAGPVLRLSYGMLDAADLAEALDRLFSGLRRLLATDGGLRTLQHQHSVVGRQGQIG